MWRLQVTPGDLLPVLVRCGMPDSPSGGGLAAGHDVAGAVLCRVLYLLMYLLASMAVFYVISRLVCKIIYQSFCPFAKSHVRRSYGLSYI